ncbi:MAG: carboxypeptidase regulatory-like domain-containing protein [Saprospiraceae bacterium]|nr:carboxypeptidase regulatory-like domain-containing protein [Saprospiraceae bacterium]
MHKFILSVIIMSLCFESFGQSEGISGKIVDEQQQALAYVTVFLKKSSDSTIYKVETTNEAGSFQFTGVQEGSYLLKAEFLGYKPFQKEINFKMADGKQE